jgi:hypothetical protein
MRTTLSVIEYSLCSRRWMKQGGGMGCERGDSSRRCRKFYTAAPRPKHR